MSVRGVVQEVLVRENGAGRSVGRIKVKKLVPSRDHGLPSQSLVSSGTSGSWRSWGLGLRLRRGVSTAAAALARASVWSRGASGASSVVASGKATTVQAASASGAWAAAEDVSASSVRVLGAWWVACAGADAKHGHVGSVVGGRLK